MKNDKIYFKDNERRERNEMKDGRTSAVAWPLCFKYVYG